MERSSKTNNDHSALDLVIRKERATFAMMTSVGDRGRQELGIGPGEWQGGPKYT